MANSYLANSHTNKKKKKNVSPNIYNKKKTSPLGNFIALLHKITNDY